MLTGNKCRNGQLNLTQSYSHAHATINITKISANFILNCSPKLFNFQPFIHKRADCSQREVWIL